MSTILKPKEDKDKKLLTTPAPSGEMLLGDKTAKERKDEAKKYRKEMLNE